MAQINTLYGLSETELASYQTRQVGNTCGFHVITSAMRLLFDEQINPNQLSADVDRLWWRGHFMRLLPGWAVTPRMQVRVVQFLARTHHLPVTAEFLQGNPKTLPEVLASQNCIPIVTLTWLAGQAPSIFLGRGVVNFNASRAAGGHSMLLAAYDPEHISGDQSPTPWGFINSWKDNSRYLFWMSDDEFRKAWRFWLPFNGPNPLVLIHRKSG